MMNLDSQEKKILLFLKDEKKTAKEISEASHISVAAIDHAAARLSEKGLVNIDEQAFKVVEAGEEGKKYLKEGFPERKILNEIGHVEKTIGELSGKLGKETVQIGSVWLRKLNAAFIAGGVIKITEQGKEYLNKKMPHEDVLEKISRNECADAAELAKRGNIVKIKEMKHRTFEISGEGKKLVQAGITIEDEVSQLTPEMIITQKWKGKKLREYDLSAPVGRVFTARKQHFKEFLDETRETMANLGYAEETGPLIETEFWNFDALFQAQNHPAREVHDVYNLKGMKERKFPDAKIVDNVRKTHENGWKTGSKGWKYKWDEKISGRQILRSQTTAVTVRSLLKVAASKEKYSKIFCLGKNFRPDVVDAKHLPEFYQIDCIVAGEGLNLQHLLGLLKECTEKVAGITELRFMPAYFPFTEPSIEVFGNHPKHGWIELGGSGIFRPEVTMPLGINKPVLAWAFGIDRLAMFKFGFDDIRDLYSQDLKKLREIVI